MTGKLSPVESTAVSIDDDLWSPRIRTNTNVTLEHQYERLRDTGRLDNFEKASRGTGEFVGRYYNDSDVYKWLEAASYVLSRSDRPELRERVGDVIRLVEDAQEEDGYLNTYFTLEVPREKRWTNASLHELYNAGHLFEAAVAHHRATGEDRLLDVARRFADHVDEVFGPDGKLGIPGHEEIELALVKLYRETDEIRYLDLAEFFAENRGREDSPLKQELENIESIANALYNPDGTDSRELYRRHMLDEDGEYSGTYMQDHLPIREQTEVVGHAVRAMYYYSGVSDLAMELDDPTLRQALERLWTNMTTKRMYVTGALGSTYENEGFTEDFDLPKDTAYAETCAAVGNVLWNHRMLQLTGESKYADIMELALYNAVLAGIALDGERFRYVNPHESDGRHHPLRDIDPGPYDQERFSLEYQGWFKTACCPPNAARLLAGLHKYIYLRSEQRLAVNLYIGSTVEITVGETPVTLRQETDYPWDGGTRFEVTLARPTTFELALRHPDWSPDLSIDVNGESVTPETVNGYAVLNRTWEDGDTVELSMSMPVRQLESHPKVPSTAGQLAVQRGPIVYCVEEVDIAVSPHELRLPVETDLQPKFEKDTLEGVTVLTGTARRLSDDEWQATLYRTRTGETTEREELKMVPYYDWGERGVGQMRIWLERID